MLQRLAPVDGLRAMAHISLVLCHAALLSTGHLPNSGPLWHSFKKSNLFFVFLAGGVQVDVMFLLSGFLLVLKLISTRDGERYPGLLVFALHRCVLCGRPAPHSRVAAAPQHRPQQLCVGIHYDGNSPLLFSAPFPPSAGSA